MQKKSFNKPDEIMSPPKTKVEILMIDGKKLMRNKFEPGWKWSVHVKPTTGNDSCQLHHLLYGISGNLKAVMTDGTEIEVGPGDVANIPPGHDAWVIGDEPVIQFDAGSAIYAKVK